VRRKRREEIEEEREEGTPHHLNHVPLLTLLSASSFLALPPTVTPFQPEPLHWLNDNAHVQF